MQKITLIIFILISNLTFGQEKTYQLISKTENADINYKAFSDYDDYQNVKLKKAFEPKKGNNDVYFFISEFQGDSFDGTQKTFHDYLILKVDPETGFVIDGFQYTLEWAEPPAISDLYQITEKNVQLVDGLELEALKMELVESDYMIDWKTELNDKAKLKLK